MGSRRSSHASTTSSTSCTRNARSCTGTWARAWRRASSLRLAKTWRRWRKITRRWASKPRRARARRRVMATSSEQAPAEEVRDGGAHLDRKLLFASCELNVEKHMCVSTQSINDLHAFYAGCQCVFHEDLLLSTRTI